jgi:hypothetical protein
VHGCETAPLTLSLRICRSSWLAAWVLVTSSCLLFFNVGVSVFTSSSIGAIGFDPGPQLYFFRFSDGPGAAFDGSCAVVGHFV